MCAEMRTTMRFISWNVNGLRACVQKGFLDFFHSIDADFFCIQESKLQEGQISLDLDGYHQYWNYAEKRGTPAPQFLQKRNLLPLPTASELRSMIRKGA